MERGTPAPSRLARCTGYIGRGSARPGRGLFLVTLLGVVVLAVSVVIMWVNESRTVTRVTITMPCSQVDATAVGHAAYGLDQVLTASCSPAIAAHR